MNKMCPACEMDAMNPNVSLNSCELMKFDDGWDFERKREGVCVCIWWFDGKLENEIKWSIIWKRCWLNLFKPDGTYSQYNTKPYAIWTYMSAFFHLKKENLTHETENEKRNEPKKKKLTTENIWDKTK